MSTSVDERVVQLTARFNPAFFVDNNNARTEFGTNDFLSSMSVVDCINEMSEFWQTAPEPIGSGLQ